MGRENETARGARRTDRDGRGGRYEKKTERCTYSARRHQPTRTRGAQTATGEANATAVRNEQKRIKWRRGRRESTTTIATVSAPSKSAILCNLVEALLSQFKDLSQRSSKCPSNVFSSPDCILFKLRFLNARLYLS